MTEIKLRKNEIRNQRLHQIWSKRINSIICFQVNTNGDLTFENPLGTFTPAPFPYQQNATLIAAYWGDVDTTNGGDILYRQSNDPGLLLQASTEIRSVFPQQGMFNATWMFITTWENVAFYGANEIGKRKVGITISV